MSRFGDFVAERETRRQNLSRIVFGVVGQSSAFDSIAMRDAQDRASTLSTIDEATAMLHRANHTGDEMLAKATAHSAFDLGWTGVANQYADATGKREALDCLTEANEGRYSRLVDSMVFGVRNPAEFESATEPTLRQFANVHAPGMEKDSPQQPRSPIPAALHSRDRRFSVSAVPTSPPKCPVCETGKHNRHLHRSARRPIGIRRRWQSTCDVPGSTAVPALLRRADPRHIAISYYTSAVLRVAQSALKRGHTIEDISHAYDLYQYEDVIDPDAEPPKMLTIGPDPAGNFLELIGGEQSNGDHLIWHAMRCRPLYLALLPDVGR